MKNDSYYMQKALDLAQKGKGTTSPNPMVGAVVVKNDVIIGQGYHQYYGGPHAEVYALEEAGQEAKDAVLYVNLEPCSHYGKTPPCSRKIIKAGISKVVIAMED
ncbi:MAG: bifunctional diaminohydroxyphosphoribosylaminopyrimidine deaminase/5-amino-6-(5-phosphoribosylamino)uracil reductase RibD, partial [Halanaerobiales bacterium]